MDLHNLDKGGTLHTALSKPIPISKVMPMLETAKKMVEDGDPQMNMLPPAKPQGGDLFVYWDQGDPFRRKDWRCDKIKWNCKGNHKLPRGKRPLFNKMYFSVATSDSTATGEKCNKHGYALLDHPGIILIHYLGNEKLWDKQEHQRIRTCPSVIAQAKEQLSTASLPPIKIYQQSVTSDTAPGQQGITNLKNLKQTQNLKYVESCKKRLSKDDLYNAIELAYHLPDCVWKVDVFPDFLAIVGLVEIMAELDNIIKAGKPVSLSYDTTFTLGDFYVSALVYRHTSYTSEPIIPAAFIIHDRKFQKVHEIFFEYIAQKVPTLCRKGLVIVTDREVGITNAISKVLPEMTIYHCWNHLKGDVRFWLKKRSVKADEVAIYVSNVERLLKADSSDDYNELYNTLSEKWSKPFLQTDIIQYSVKCVVQGYPWFDTSSGVTNNISESMNRVLKQLQDWAEAPVDVVILALHYLQNFYFAELQRGKIGVGNYNLKEKNSAIADEENMIPKNVVALQDIVAQIRNMPLSFPSLAEKNVDVQCTEKNFHKKRSLV